MVPFSLLSLSPGSQLGSLVLCSWSLVTKIWWALVWLGGALDLRTDQLAMLVAMQVGDAGRQCRAAMQAGDAGQ